MKVLDEFERCKLGCQLVSGTMEMVYARIEDNGCTYCTIRKSREKVPDQMKTHSRDGITITVVEHFRRDDDKARDEPGVRHDVFDGAVLLHVEPQDRIDDGTALFQELYKGRSI
jgi:hypothetical protein